MEHYNLMGSIKAALSAAFASNLDDLIAKADIWVHGHMHASADYRIGQCRVVCNPCGYVDKCGRPENSNFRSDFIVELRTSLDDGSLPSRSVPG